MSKEAMKLAASVLRGSHEYKRGNAMFVEVVEDLYQAIEQAQKQEPVGVVALIDGKKIGIIYDYSVNIDSDLYTSPPQRQPLTEQWVEVTETLLNAQHPWLYEPMWIAMPNGHVTTGYYEWRQGRSPDRFITDDLGDMHAFQAAFVMPLTKPKAPIGVITHGIKEKNT